MQQVLPGAVGSCTVTPVSATPAPRRGRPRRPFADDVKPELRTLAEMIRELCDRYELGVRELAQRTKTSTTLWSKAWNAQTVPEWPLFAALLQDLRFLNPDDRTLSEERWKAAWDAAKQQFDNLKRVAGLVSTQLEKIDLKSPFYPDIVISGETVFVEYDDPSSTNVRREPVSSAATLIAFASQADGSLKEWAARVETAEGVPADSESAASILFGLWKESKTDRATQAIRAQLINRRLRRVERLAERLAGGGTISFNRERSTVAEDLRAVRRDYLLNILSTAGVLAAIGGAFLGLIILVFLALAQFLPTDNVPPRTPRDQLEALEMSGTKPSLRVYPGPPTKSALVYSITAGKSASTTFHLPASLAGRKTFSAVLRLIVSPESCTQGDINWTFKQGGSLRSVGRLAADRDPTDEMPISFVTATGEKSLSLSLRASRSPLNCKYEIHLADSGLV
jgi:hypothetical protein